MGVSMNRLTVEICAFSPKGVAKLNLKDLSMGMSSDFEQAIINGSTYLRLGTIIMGERHLNG